ncbi:MAG: SMC family ATPase [Gemmatimonadales bacterium]|nr:SMC family ATPase [Gemmatimonadales bacterium]
MFLHRLRLLNFRQHERTELELGPGLTGIIGQNGAGKTTLLEAIAWAMYGMRAARGSRDSIRRRGAPPRSRVEVELEFSLGAHRYRVVRTLNSAELYQDAEAAPIANSIDAVSERVTRLLGMTRDEFFNTYFTGQKELAVMAAMTATERAQFLSRVLGYERLKLLQDQLKQSRATQRARLEALRGGLLPAEQLEQEVGEADERVARGEVGAAVAREALGQAEATAAALAPEWEAQVAVRDRARALDAEARVAEQVARGAGAECERLQREVAEADVAAARLAELEPRLAPLAGLRREMAALAADAEGFARRTRLATQREELARQRLDLAARHAALPAVEAIREAERLLEEARGDLAAAQAAHDERRTQWAQDAQEARTKLEGLRDQYQELVEQRDRIVAAGADGTCPTCARPLGAEFAAVLGVLEGQLEEVKGNGSFYRQRVEQLKEAPPELEALQARLEAGRAEVEQASARQAKVAAERQESERVARQERQLAERLAALEAELAAVPGAHYDEARHREVQQALAVLEPLVLEAERHRTVVARSAQARGALPAAREADAAARARMAAIAAERGALQEQPERVAALERAVREAALAREAAHVRSVQADAELAAARAARGAVEERRRERAARVREADAVALALRYEEELDRALSDLRTDLNATLRPELSEVASGFLRDLTNGRYTDLELDEDYVAVLVDEGEAKGVISGGEEDVANLALRLAISQMIAERAGQPLSLLVLDEIFGSLDEDRRAAVLELLRSLADRFPQVILITHIDSVRDGFDRIVRVSYDARRGVAMAQDEPRGGSDVAA